MPAAREALLTVRAFDQATGPLQRISRELYLMGNASQKANAEMAAAQTEAAAATDRLAAAQERAAVAAADLAKIQESDILRGSQVQVTAEEEVTVALQEVTTAENEAAAAAVRLSEAQAIASRSGGDIRTSMMRTNQIVRSTGHTMLLFGGVAVAGLALAANAAADFNTQMTLAATQIGNNSKQVAADTKKLVSAGIDQLRRFGGTSQDIASAFYDIFSTLPVGFAKGVRLMNVFQRVAIAGQLGIKDATQGAITTMNSFGLKTIPQVTKGMNTLFATVRFGRTTFPELNSALATVGPAALQWNQSIKSMGGAVAFLTTRMGNVPKAAVSYARSLDVLGSQKFVDAMKKQGVVITDNAGHLLGLHKVLGRILDQFPQLAKGGIQNFLKDQIGATSTIQARRGLTFLLTQYKEYSRITRRVAGDNAEFGKSFKALRGSDAVKLQIFVGNLKALVLLIGQQAIPILVAMTKPIQALFDAFNHLSKGNQNLIIKILAFVAIAAVVVGLILTIAASIGGLLLLLGGLEIGFAAAATAIGIAIVVIGALIAIGYLLYKNWDMIKKYAKIVWNAVSDAAVSAFDTIVQAIKDAWHWITNTDFVTTLISAWNDLSNGISSHVDDIKGTVRNLWRFVKAVFSAIANSPFMDMLVSNIRTGLTILRGMWRAGWAVIRNVARGVWNAIKILVRAAWDAIKQTVRNAFKVIGDILVVAMDVIQGKWGKAWHEVVRLAKDILSSLSDLLVTVLYKIPKAIVGAAKAIGSGMVSGIIAGIESMAGTLKDAAVQVAKDALNAAKDFIKPGSPSKLFAKEIGQPIAQGIAKGIMQQSHLVSQALTDTIKPPRLHGNQAVPVGLGQRFDRGVAKTVNNYHTTYNVHAAKNENLVTALRKHDFLVRVHR